MSKDSVGGKRFSVPRGGASSTLRVGVIGFGYWGPDVVRNFHQCSGATVTSVCDRDPRALDRVRALYPAVKCTREAGDILRDPDIDAVAIVTPTSGHFPLAKAALEEGKHVFVEKPFTRTSAEAEALIDLAARKRLQIMVDHTFMFSGAVRKIRELMLTDTLGRLDYYDSTRMNLGIFQHDSNLVWDLATHDLAIIDYLLPDPPEAVIATVARHSNGLEDMAFVTIYFPDKVMAHLNVNWLAPVKIRMTLIGGEKSMLVWDDLAADEKIKLYDRGNARPGRMPSPDLQVSYRAGDMWAPRVASAEALGREVCHFVECVASGETPINDGLAGLRVVKMLEAIDESIAGQGRLVPLALPARPCER